MKRNRCMAVAATTALLCTMLPLTSHAADTQIDWDIRTKHAAADSVCSLENGKVAKTEVMRMEGFIVVTDGTALTADALPALPEGYTVCVTPLTWEDEKPSFCENYPDGSAFFQVHYTEEHTACMPAVDFVRYARQLMMAHAEITDAFLMTYELGGTIAWDGDFTVWLMGVEVPVDRSEIFAADPDYQTAQSAYQAYKTALDAWEAATDTTGMTDAEIAASRAAAGVPTDAEMIAYAESFLTNQYENASADNSFNVYEYQAASIGVSYAFTPDMSTLVYKPEPVWENAGNVNGDDSVDASDAARILEHAAIIGSGGSSSMLSGVTENADVNADMSIDAQDAAYILQFAAEAGAGSALSIGEFMTRK